MENVDKKNIGLPSRYINALYDLCDEAKNLKKITQDFEKFIKLVEDNKKLNNLLLSPTVGKTNQGKILNDILKKGKADKLTINFCGVLCRNGRVNLITKIMREFLNEVARRRGEIVVEVFSPYKLDKKEEDDLKKIILLFISGLLFFGELSSIFFDCNNFFLTLRIFIIFFASCIIEISLLGDPILYIFFDDFLS